MTVDDSRLNTTLRGFVRAADPILASLGRAGQVLDRDRAPDSGLLDRLTATLPKALPSGALPGTSAFDSRPLEARCRWWASRIGETIAVPVAAPHVLGSMADRFPVQSAITLTGKALVVCAVGRECGERDADRRAEVLAEMVLDRRLDLTEAVDLEPTDPMERPEGTLSLMRRMVTLGMSLWRAVSDVGSEVERLAPVRARKLSDRFLVVAVAREVRSQQREMRQLAEQACATFVDMSAQGNRKDVASGPVT